MTLEQDSSLELRTVGGGNGSGCRPGHGHDENAEQRHASDERSG
jgi:hypothetical protein